jgi:hypothetical protein
LKQFRSISVALALCLSLAGAATASAKPGETPGSGRSPAHARSRALPPVAPAGNDALTRGLRRGTLSAPQYALARAQSVFQLGAVRREHGDVERTDPSLTTLLLRDLALRASELTGAEQRQANRLLARPDDSDEGGAFEVSYTTEPVTECTAAPISLCIHYVQTTDDATTPDQVQDTKTTFETVWNSIVVEQGYRAPKSDSRSANPGPNGNLDIYLADIGAKGIYGYCTSDDPNLQRLGSPRYPYYDVSAYCVLDNDYAQDEFPAGTPLGNLQVTAAHEFFHAIQFAYDVTEDGWFLEGTAVAIEDHVYDDINDNYQYLLSSQLTRPSLSLDYSASGLADPNSGSMYGSWLFWRFMSEALSDGTSIVDVDVIKEVWERADASAAQAFRDEYSLQAAARVSGARGTKFRKLYRDFVVANTFPEAFYSEGVGYATFAGRPPFEPVVLGDTKLRSGALTKMLDHLSASYTSFTPGAGVSEAALLKLKVNLPNRKRGSKAVAVVRSTDGILDTAPITLNRDGDGVIIVGFGPAAVAEVILVLANASDRIKNCYQVATNFSCSGVPRDNGQTFSYKGILRQPSEP